MIGKLKGIIDEIEDGVAVIDVGGVGYNVFCTDGFATLSKEKDEVTLFVETVVREEAFLLFGFLTKMERTWFRLFQEKVNGVGAKTAMAILSKLSPSEMAEAVDKGDHKPFLLVPGIGQKVAQRIVAELKGKVPEGSYFDEGTNSSKVSKNVEDAVSALVNLGFPKDRAALAIRKVIENDNTVSETEVLIRRGMKMVSAL